MSSEARDDLGAKLYEHLTHSVSVAPRSFGAR